MEGHGKTVILEINPLERIEITNIKLVLLSGAKRTSCSRSETLLAKLGQFGLKSCFGIFFRPCFPCFPWLWNIEGSSLFRGG